ncbi:methylenetetrahydrofolate reductase [Georgenia sp. TF02-10]|uniref:methylenetetrahydrofolate reductase n=1 Tax=Georgenia sp. TF02-10 TaxID=2917725 RepID=UPI001FA75735|nr:methylenetetrahydrofolate reductase [Georgenia sp. TF02-10]UNX55057.1 methylenetetrahydrofolate reductase [Georgenia sp. TF02-10]
MPTTHPTVSFELYPPRRPELDEVVWQRVLRMAAAGPDFFSVTYGASGTSRAASAELVRRILTTTGVPPIAHLTCVGATRAELAALVGRLLDAGVRDFLALRGDPPAGQTAWQAPAGGLGRASELVALIREVEEERLGPTRPDGGRATRPEPPSAVATDLGVTPADVVSVAVATYPTGSSHSRTAELAALKEKQDAGADFAITQVFYDAAAYASLVADARAAGVHIPILPGVIPLTDPGRLHRLAGLTGVPVPPSLDALLATPDEADRVRRGIDATLELIDRVLAAGAPGIHLYTFNHDRPALDVLAHLRARGVRNPAIAAATRPATHAASYARVAGTGVAAAGTGEGAGTTVPTAPSPPTATTAPTAAPHAAAGVVRTR